MASYNSGFDPPTRPVDLVSKERNWGSHKQQLARHDNREFDMVYEVERKASLPGSRLPRPCIQQPYPAPTSESRLREITGFGFRKPVEELASAASGQRELKGTPSRNVLRRKQSSIGKASEDIQNSNDKNLVLHDERRRVISPAAWSQASPDMRPSVESSSKSRETHSQIFTRSPRTKASVKEPVIYPELDRYRPRINHNPDPTRVIAGLPHKLATEDLPPPTPLSLSGTPLLSSGVSHHQFSGYTSGSACSAGSSTRFSESPGPGPYSRDSTPTSISSQSPGIVTVKSTTSRLGQGSPVLNRPPVTRRRAGINVIEAEAEGKNLDPQGLPSLRESVTSSSSNSTVKVDVDFRDKKEEKRLSLLPSSPPPRKSSRKSKKKTLNNQESTIKSSLAPSNSSMVAAEQQSEKSQKDSPSPHSRCAPSRPSRVGAPDLQSQLDDTLPVIRSKLVDIGFSKRTRSDLLHPRASPKSPIQQPQKRSVLWQGTRIPSRSGTPSPALSHTHPKPTSSGLGIITDLRPQLAGISFQGTHNHDLSPNLSSKPRFTLFGRHTKSIPDVSTDKMARKGPAAGTGHEGYGKYANRGRSTSSIGKRRHDRSTSTTSRDSIGSSKIHDPFFLERINPVVIVGGGVIQDRTTSSELTRTDSSGSFLDTHSIISTQPSVNSGLIHKVSHTLWPSTLLEDSRKVSLQARQRSDSEIEKDSSAFRQSLHRVNTDGATSLQRTISMSSAAPSPSLTSIDTSVISDDLNLSIDPHHRSKAKGISSSTSRKLEKRLKSPIRWNPFNRSRSMKEAETQSAAVSVAVHKLMKKSLPHYALLDSSDDQLGFGASDIEDMLRATVKVEETGFMPQIPVSDRRLFDDLEQTQELGHNKAPSGEKIKSTLFPVQAELVSAPLPLEPHETKEIAAVRPSRLPQVGRIPRVISARPQTSSPKSFSRPFARLSSNDRPPLPRTSDQESIALGLSPPELHFGRPETPQETSKHEESKHHYEIVSFNPRKGSETTTHTVISNTTTASNSSSGISFAGTTAVIPEPDAELEEDEVWDEYNDLIENNDQAPPSSATSSNGYPFQYECFESRRPRKSRQKFQMKEEATEEERIGGRTFFPREALATSSLYSEDMSAKLRNSGLKAEALLKTPTTTLSFSDFITGYQGRNSVSTSAQSIRPASESSLSTSGSNKSRDRRLPQSQVNLRVASMTVSKWLTFGHVLFSPAREETGSLKLQAGEKQYNILVIDGLGNDDWSFYAAESYPDCTFYNLSPTPAPSTSSVPSTRTDVNATIPSIPQNHFQAPFSLFASPEIPFPFPNTTFHATILRFPPSLPASAYTHLITQSNRVLRPGGFLELTVLDRDMVSMGPRCRRALRSLKAKLQNVEKIGNDSGLMGVGSASDFLLRCLGGGGGEWETVKSCRVGVPVISTISSPPKSVSSTTSTSGPRKQKRTSSKSPRREMSSVIGKKKLREETSLAEMIKSPPSLATDQGIANMVAQVGRWWWKRCYELESGGETESRGTEGEGFWSDRKLLRECEEWGTNFTLMVACARKAGDSRPLS